MNPDDRQTIIKPNRITEIGLRANTLVAMAKHIQSEIGDPIRLRELLKEYIPTIQQELAGLIKATDDWK